MKYVMSIEIEAEQFLPEQDKIPQGVTSDGLRSPKTDPRSSWVLLNKKYGMKYISSGDYIITEPDGSQYSVPSDIFEAQYKPIGS